jgi:hypothetical protein
MIFSLVLSRLTSPLTYNDSAGSMYLGRPASPGNLEMFFVSRSKSVRSLGNAMRSPVASRESVRYSVNEFGHSVNEIRLPVD